MGRRRTAVLVSGNGSNLQALLDAAAAPDYPAAVELVIANRPDAFGLARARRAGVAAQVIEHRRFADRGAFDAALAAAIEAAAIETVCLAGFMRVLGAGFVERFAGRLLNIHPALLPAFPGLDTHARALRAGVRLHGCTVHGVTAAVDAGPILVQGAVPVLDGDTPGSLAARVLELEHRCYPLALRLHATGQAAGAAERLLLHPLLGGGLSP